MTSRPCHSADGRHTPYPAVVHSNVADLETFLDECERLMADWDLTPKEPCSASPQESRSIEKVLQECPGASLHKDTIQDKLLVLHGDEGNDLAFDYLCQSRKCKNDPLFGYDWMCT